MPHDTLKPVALAVCTAVGGLALSGSAFAMTTLPSGYMAAAAAAGEKGDAKRATLTQAEFLAAHKGKTAADFAKLDTNGDGQLDATEQAAAKAAKTASGDAKGKMQGEGKCGEGKCGGAA